MLTQDDDALSPFSRESFEPNAEIDLFAGDQARAVSVLKVDWQGVPVNLAIYTLKEERGVLKATPAGRPIERAGIQAVTQLLSAPA